MVVFRSLDDHLTACPGVELTCSCGVKVLRQDMAVHESSVCPDGIVVCPFAPHGCSHAGVRSLHERHQVECSVYHSNLVAAKVLAMDAKMLAMEQEAQRGAARTLALEGQLMKHHGTIEYRFDGVAAALASKGLEFWYSPPIALFLGSDMYRMRILVHTKGDNRLTVAIGVKLVEVEDHKLPVCVGGSCVTLHGREERLDRTKRLRAEKCLTNDGPLQGWDWVSAGHRCIIDDSLRFTASITLSRPPAAAPAVGAAAPR